jgi:hypothetical protein
MVFVDKKPPLINLEDIKSQNIFCYYANQQRTYYLMNYESVSFFENRYLILRWQEHYFAQ